MRNKIEEISSIDNFFFSFVCYGQNVEWTEGGGGGGGKRVARNLYRK